MGVKKREERMKKREAGGREGKGGGRRRRTRRTRRTRRRKPQYWKIDYAHEARRNSRYLGHTAVKVAWPAVRRVN